MANIAFSAFLQPHVRPVAVREGAATHLLYGTRVGVWRVMGKPRRGTLTDTYPVTLEESGEHASLTLIDAPALALGSYARRILTTCQNINRIDHPGVVPMIDAGLAADGRPYYVSEVCDGMTLAEYLPQAASLDLEHVIAILRGICAPLAAAHELGMVHGGLSSEHVLIVENRDVKLLDWGVERAVLEEARRAGVERADQVTCSAPELAFGVASPQGDAYALGVIAYELLCGQPPFVAADSVSMQQAQAQTPDVRSFAPEIPRSLEAMILGLLAYDPRQRPSILTVAEELAQLSWEMSSAREPQPEPNSARASWGAKISSSLRWPTERRSRIVASTLVAAIAITGVLLVAEGQESTAVGATTRVETAPARAAIVQPQARVAQTRVAQTRVVPTPDVPKKHATPRIATTTRKTPAAVAVIAPTPRPAPPARPTAPRKVESAPAPVKAVARSADATKPAKRGAPEVQTDEKAKLLAEYQRVGHALIELRQVQGTLTTSELWEEFRALKIQAALASAETRATAKATLKQLADRIQRSKGVAVSEACAKNPLAAGCK